MQFSLMVPTEDLKNVDLIINTSIIQGDWWVVEQLQGCLTL